MSGKDSAGYRPDAPLTEEQKQYLAGFAAGAGLARSASPAVTPAPAEPGPAAGATGPRPVGPEAIHIDAQDRVLAAGGKLAREERAKRQKNPLDMWDEMEARALRGAFPKGDDVFLTKFHGLFYVAPAGDAYMCRLRIPGGVLDSRQFRGVADLAEMYGGGYTHVTTRANLQIRRTGRATLCTC